MSRYCAISYLRRFKVFVISYFACSFFFQQPKSHSTNDQNLTNLYFKNYLLQSFKAEGYTMCIFPCNVQSYKLVYVSYGSKLFKRLIKWAYYVNIFSLLPMTWRINMVLGQYSQNFFKFTNWLNKPVLYGRHSTQHNDNQHNDTQHNDIQHNNK